MFIALKIIGGGGGGNYVVEVLAYHYDIFDVPLPAYKSLTMLDTHSVNNSHTTL